MIRIFRGKTAVHVSCPYSGELPCIISRKSLESFLRKIGNKLTNQLTNGSDSMGPAPQLCRRSKIQLSTQLQNPLATVYMTRLCSKNVDFGSLIRLIRLIRLNYANSSIHFCSYQISFIIRYQRYMTRLCSKNVDFGSLIRLIRLIRLNYAKSSINVCSYQISFIIRFQRYMIRLCSTNVDFGSLIRLIRH